MLVKSSFLTTCDLSLHFYFIILVHEEEEEEEERLFSVPDCAGFPDAAGGAVKMETSL